MLRFIFRLVRLLVLGAVGAAVAAKFLLHSTGDENSQEIDLVTIFDGTRLVSRADPFYGGKVTTVFGGAEIDLRNVTPAPTGIDLDVLVGFGGVEILVPAGWRVRFDGTLFAGGFENATETPTDPDATTVRVGGLVCFGGVQAANRARSELVQV